MTDVRRRLLFSTALAAVALSFLLLFPGGVKGISLSIQDDEPAGGYLLGSTIELSGSVALNDSEFIQVQSVGVVIDGPQPCSATMPLDEGTNQVVDCSPAGSGELSIDVEYSNVAYGFGFLGYGYGYGYGYGFNGVGDSAVLDYTVNWTPPIFLDPAPEYTLLPATGPSFDIPQITLPERDPNLPDDMPAITSLFSIPPIESVDPNAPDGLPSLEILANRIPLATSGDPDPAEMPTLTALANDIPTATSGSPAIAALGTITALANQIPLATAVDENDTFLEDSTALANAIPLATSGTPDPAELPTPTEVGSIPDASPALPAGVSELPTVAEAFDIVTATTLLGVDSTIRGLTSDGTDFFAVVDDGSDEDVVIKVNASGVLDTTFGTSGMAALPDAGQGGRNFKAITWLNDKLYVADADEICNESGCDRKIFVLNDSTGAQTASFTNPSGTITGLTVDDGDIVGITDQHCELVVFNSNGNHEQNINSDNCGNQTNALAAGFFTANSGTVHSVNDSADRGASYTASPTLSSIRGAVVVNGVLYLADSSKVYKTAAPSGITTTPTGMTFDGTYIWVITDNDAGGVDTLLKLSATDGSLVSSYDAPSAYARGLTFLDDSLWVFYYDNSNGDHPKFVEVNEETGAIIGSAKSPGCCYSSYGGMSTDGDDVFLINNSNDGWRPKVKSFKTSNGSGADVDVNLEGGDGGDPELSNGANALTYRSSKAQWFGAKGGELVAMDASLKDIDGMSWDLEVDSADLEIMGLAFDDDNSIVYMVDDVNDKIYKASIPSGETTDPVALAFGGGYLWVVTDGEMGEDKILKLNSSTGALEASMNAPNDSIVGMAYLENALRLAYNDGNTPKVVEVNPTTGAYDLDDAFNVPFSGCCGSQISGLTQDGDELIAQGTGRQVVSFDTEGDEGEIESTDFECCDQENGVNGFAYRTAKDQFFRAKDEELIAWDSSLKVISDFQFDMESDSEEMDIMGVAFDNTNDVIYIADDETDYIYTAMMPTGETQNPKAMAYDGTNLWVITEGTAGTDKLLKLNPDTGALVSSYDAPNDDTVGMTYADSLLWVAYTSETCCSGDQSSFVAVDPSDGSFDLGDAETYEMQGHSLVGGALTHNGSVFVAFGGGEGRTYSFDDGGDQDGPFNNQDADALNSGADALAYRSAKSQYFAAKDETLQAFNSGMSSVSSMEWDLTSDGTTELEIKALTFNNTDDIIYIADDETDYIYVASLPTGETTNPKAMAHDGTNLWLVTEGTTGNDKILKLNADTGALVSSFDAPNDDTVGMTYFENALWLNYVTSSEHGGDENKFVEVNPTTGVYDLGDANEVPIDGCCPLNAGGFTNNGNQLVAVGDGEGRMVSFDTDGDKEGPYNNQNMDGGPFSNGSKNLAYRSAKTQYFVGKDDRLGAYNSDLNSISSFGFDLTSDGTTPLDIQALTFDNVNDVIYVADDETDKIFIASLPRGETTNPRAMAYDGTNLWVVTQGTAGNDKILKLDADTGALVSSFDAPSDNTLGLTYWENSLWYAYMSESNCCGDVGQVVEVNPITGAFDVNTAAEIPMQGCCPLDPGGLTSVSQGGESYLLAVGDGEGKISSFNSNGDQDGPHDSDFLNGGPFEGNGADNIAHRSSKNHIFVGTGDEIGAYNNGRDSIERLDFSGLVGVDELGDPVPMEMNGLTFVGDVIYIADDATDAIYRASIPPPDSNPTGLTTDGDSLYILVDGDSGDNIIKTDLDGNLVTAFGVSGIQETVSANTNAIAYSNEDGRLYVSYTEDNCCGNDDKKIVPVNATTGQADVGDEFQLQNIPGFGGNMPSLGGLAALDDMLVLGVNGPSWNPAVDLDGDFDDDGSAMYSGGSGKTAMAIRTLSSGVVEVFFADGTEIAQWEFEAMNTQGIPSMESWDLSIGDIQGMTIIDKVIYVAEDTTDTIFVAAIPDPEVDITQTPKGMATNGTNLYAVVDASPKDWIAVLSPSGTLISNFMAPADDIGGITVFDDSIWLGGREMSECDPFCNGPGAKLYKMSMGGVLQATYNVDFQGGDAGDITGMTYVDPGDGSIELLVANNYHHGWFSYDVDYLSDDGNSSNNPSETVYAQGGGGQTGFESLLYVSELNSVAALKHTGGGSKLILFDSAGNGTGQSNMLQGAQDVTGLAYLDVSCSQSPAPCSFLFLTDGGNDEVREAVFDTNVPEPSTYGSYTAQLTTIYNSSVDAEDPQTTTIGSSLESFELVKATSVDIAITSPATGVTVDTPTIVVSFTVDDPSVTQVILGAELATGEVFGDSADDGEVSENKWEITNSSSEVGWHIDCDGKAMSGPCSWHYASDVQGDGDYDTSGEPNSGTLTIAESITVKSGTALQFNAWYNTETFPAYDQKWVEVDIQGDDEDDSGWLAIAQIIAPGESADEPDNAHASYFTKPIQSANAMFQPAQFGVGGCPPYCEPTFAPIWEPVFIDLEGAFDEDTVLDIRFRFDTIDGAVNQMEGWYIDNVSITGESSAASASATVEDGVASFEIAEGSNSITLQAVIPYDSTVTDADTIIVFLDTIEPLITMDQDIVEDPDVPDIITSSTQYTVTGGFEELNATFLQMKVTTVVGTTTPYVDKSPSATGSFEINVNLAEGDNLVTVEVTDGAGRIGSASALIFLDTLGPTYTPLGTVYPVGVSSARAGDPLIFQINAGDAASDVKCVEVIWDNEIAQENDPCEGEQEDENGNVAVSPFVRPEDIPEAVRDSWGATGEWLYPTVVPSLQLPGSFEIPVRIADSAGNSTYATVTATITASLSAINIGLMPGENLISLPLIPDDAADGNLARLMEENQRVGEITEAIWYYDATLTNEGVEDRWKVYTPAGGDVDDLLDLDTGRGYWWITDDDQYEYSDPLPGLSQETPQVENFAYTGVFLRRGAEAPPVYDVVSGWNLVGFHSEKTLTANEYLSALGRGDSAGWSSLLRFDNFIDFPIAGQGEERDDPRFELGHFTRVFSAEDMEPTQGFWLYSTEEGVITP